MPEGGEPLDPEALAAIVQKRMPLYDKAADGHYNLISALHKSVRGSDPDAALYYLARMLTAGEDPLFSRAALVRMAIEDVGLADPEALHQALAAKDTYDFLGSPEGRTGAGAGDVYLATAPKSNAGYTAYKAAMGRAKETGSLMPPKIILNAPTKMMKQQEYGAGYDMTMMSRMLFPARTISRTAWAASDTTIRRERGFEREMKRRLDYWAKLRKERGLASFQTAERGPHPPCRHLLPLLPQRKGSCEIVIPFSRRDAMGEGGQRPDEGSFRCSDG